MIFEATANAGKARLLSAILGGLIATALLAGAAHHLGVPDNRLGAVIVGGFIAAQVLVLVAIRPRAARLLLENGEISLRVGRSRRPIQLALTTVGFARWSTPQIGAMGTALSLAGPAGRLTIAIRGRALSPESYSMPPVVSPDCMVEPLVFDALLAALGPHVRLETRAAAPTRFEIFANKSSTVGVLKVLAYCWFVVLPLTVGASFLAERAAPEIQAAPPLAAGAALVIAGGLGIGLGLSKRTRAVAVERGVLSLTEGKRLLFSVPLGAIQLQRLQYDARMRGLSYRLPGLAMRLPDGQVFAVGARHMGGWAMADAKKNGEPDWLMGPAELPLLAALLGVNDALTQDG